MNCPCSQGTVIYWRWSVQGTVHVLQVQLYSGWSVQGTVHLLQVQLSTGWSVQGTRHAPQAQLPFWELTLTHFLNFCIFSLGLC